MIPPGYTRLVLADTRRALAWERGLARAGFRPLRVEARGSEAARADWEIAVPSAQASAARSYVTEVVSGRARLPHVPALSRTGRIALAGVAVVAAALCAIALIGR